MADKITVIACQGNEVDGYKTLLSDGREVLSFGAYNEGAEYVEPETFDRTAFEKEVASFKEKLAGGVTANADDMDSLKQKLETANEHIKHLEHCKDDADRAVVRLRDELDVANASIATLTRDLNEARDTIVRLRQARATAPVPEGLIGVTTAKVDNLPSIDQLPAHATMEPGLAPGVPESQDQRDVREHLERKAAAIDLDGPFASGGDGDEGTKPQE